MTPKVLISDDEPLMVKALVREARLNGLSPIPETSAAHVMDAAKAEQPDVIILDLRQHGMDGRDVLARLKSDPQTRDVPVVVLSGIEDQFTRLNCLELGAYDYQTKPLDPTFMTRVARLAHAHMASPKGPLGRFA